MALDRVHWCQQAIAHRWLGGDQSAVSLGKTAIEQDDPACRQIPLIEEQSEMSRHRIAAV